LHFPPSLAHADSGAFRQSVGVDEAQAAGLDMMLLNSSLLRNGDNVWERAREGFQLPEVNADIVRKQERLYSSKPEYFKRILDRSHKYLFHIMNEVERRGMPTEIAFLPVVESAFVPTANSPVGAAGLWQFMPATGRHYGLEQTWWYDGRRDIMEATRAALDYLQNLYAQFGDWNLALAAYNWGEGNLARAIARAQAAGLEPTYENIKMPNETRNYAPKLIAVRNILSQPENTASVWTSSPTSLTSLRYPPAATWISKWPPRWQACRSRIQGTEPGFQSAGLCAQTRPPDADSAGQGRQVRLQPVALGQAAAQLAGVYPVGR
jgi:membrane-bound lytic murein transglycosylase D